MMLRKYRVNIRLMGWATFNPWETPIRNNDAHWSELDKRFWTEKGAQSYARLFRLTAWSGTRTVFDTEVFRVEG